MNIVCLIDTIEGGGAQRQLVILAALLKKNGHHVELIYYHPGDFYETQLIEQGVAVKCYTDGPKIVRLWNVVARILKSKPDALIAFLPMPSLLAELMSFLTDAKIIVSERSLGIARPGRFANLQFWIHRFADFVVANSHAQKAWIEENHPALNGKVVEILNCVDTDIFQPENMNGSGPTKIVAVGRIDAQKNPIILLEATARLVEKYPLEVHWYGHIGDEQYNNKLIEKIADLSAESYFKLHEPVRNIAAIYKQADYVCLPTSLEGCSNVICEAISTGKIVITTPAGDNERLVQHDLNGFIFAIDNLDSLIASLQSALELPLESKLQMEKKSREIALKLLSKTRFLEQYEALLH